MARMHSTTVATAHTSSCKLDEVATINSGYGFGSDMPACSCAFQSIFKSNSYIYINMPVGTSGLRERERGLVLRMVSVGVAIISAGLSLRHLFLNVPVLALFALTCQKCLRLEGQHPHKP